ncbi:type IV secretion system protein [Sphingobium sp. BYY-5]|uniref:virB8 family protein n=1 Tax=Sphingobium sp. BYY-5 TaxID=2926400 RepID=UPI001FA742E6|nr:type IV secretion system protein [Sphingobium sp. BYY-5]MCI4590579.1 type IV secretion system protein [Sphingobium sp. BYY-5]
MTSAPNEPLDSYFEQAHSWSEDRTDALRSSRRTAWIVAIVAVTVAVLEALALVLLVPLKQVEPYTLMVDRQTGYVQLLKPLEPQLLSSNAALTQSFLVQYVIGRESFDINVLQANYRKVALWSTGQARTAYLAQMPASNPGSPLALYPRNSIVSVRVKSITTMGQNSALVRFDTVRQDAGRPPAAARPWVTMVRYSYSNTPMSVEDRYVNPLGFQVQSYNMSAEALPPEPAPSPSAPLSQPTTAPAGNEPQGRVVIPAPRRQAAPEEL